ncbi:MAG: type I phosphomannose isomerase catalytic subunit [Prolixibacteraceae bacterium]
MSLYPFKFQPILKERIWGGNKLETRFGKNLEGKTNIGESWELSAVEGDVSMVTNGHLAGNDLQELIEIYMDDIVGEKIYEQFGTEFPLLIKLIDANDDLSIQVHPNDQKAKERHNAYGKTEMWVALDDQEKPRLITGFNQDTSQDAFLKKLNDGSLTELFNYEEVKKGDAYFVPAGRVHAICAGNLIAEIQQTSDITYRIYDYDRKDKDGNGRELHLDWSLDVMDYQKVKDPKVIYTPELNKATELVSCNYFTTNVLNLSQPIERDYYAFDSFVVLMCLEGACTVGQKGGEMVEMQMGDTVLIPASLNLIIFEPIGQQSKLLEVYIK